MSLNQHSKDLLVRWEAGSQAAAEELYLRHARKLWALAEKEIGRHLRPAVDADDIVQSVFRTFFRRAAKGEFHIEYSGALWRLLVTIALNKIRRKAGRRREVLIDGDKRYLEALAHDPTPKEAVALADEIAAVVEGLGPRDAEIFQLRLQGYTTSEISERVGWSRWTVRRGLNRIENWLRNRFRKDFEHWKTVFIDAGPPTSSVSNIGAFGASGGPTLSVGRQSI